MFSTYPPSFKSFCQNHTKKLQLVKFSSKSVGHLRPKIIQYIINNFRSCWKWVLSKPLVSSMHRTKGSLGLWIKNQRTLWVNAWMQKISLIRCRIPNLTALIWRSWLLRLTIWEKFGETWQRRRLVQQFYAKMDKSRDFVLKSEAIWSFRLSVKHSSSTRFQSISKKPKVEPLS